MSGPRELLPGLYRITVPPPPCVWMTPTSSYLLFSKGRVLLVDPGYPDPEISEILEEFIPRDLSLTIVLTHGHLDHYGALEELSERPIKVLVHPGDKEKVALGVVNEMLQRKGEVEGHWSNLGFPDPQSLWEVLKALRALYPKRIPSLEPLPKQLVIGEKALKVIHTPGHTSGSVCLWIEEDGVLLTGDTLLPSGHETWLSGACFGEKGSGPAEYRNSLKKIALLDPRLVLPGHGEAFEDVKGRLLERARRNRDKRRRIMEALEGSMSAYEISLAVEPETQGFSRLLSVGSIYALLLELKEEGLVELVGRRPWRWRRP